MGRRTCSACEMTPISDIEKLERLLAEATPGEWSVSTSPDYFRGGATVIRANNALVVCPITKTPHGLANAEVIALLRNLAPPLIADWKRMRGENMCDACAGTGAPTSGRPCQCGGTGKMSDAADYLRKEVLRLTKERDDAHFAIEEVRSWMKTYPLVHLTVKKEP